MYGPVVAGPLTGVNVHVRPVDNVPEVNVEFGATGMMVWMPEMETTVNPLCDVGTTWLLLATDMV